MKRKLVQLAAAALLAVGAVTMIAGPALAKDPPEQKPRLTIETEREKTHARKVRFIQSRIPHTAPKTHLRKGLLDPKTRGMNMQAEREHTWIIKGRRSE